MITNKVNQYVTLMQSLQNFFEFSEYVSRDEFAGFTSMILSKEQALKALCWVPVIGEEQVQDYEMKARKEGFLRFTFHRNSDSKQQLGKICLPAYYVEPFEKNSAIFGQDLGGEKDLAQHLKKRFKQAGRRLSQGLF